MLRLSVKILAERSYLYNIRRFCIGLVSENFRGRGVQIKMCELRCLRMVVLVHMEIQHRWRAFDPVWWTKLARPWKAGAGTHESKTWRPRSLEDVEALIVEGSIRID